MRPPAGVDAGFCQTKLIARLRREPEMAGISIIKRSYNTFKSIGIIAKSDEASGVYLAIDSAQLTLPTPGTAINISGGRRSIRTRPKLQAAPVSGSHTKTSLPFIKDIRSPEYLVNPRVG